MKHVQLIDRHIPFRAARKPPGRRQRWRWEALAMNIVLFSVCLLVLFPVFYTIITSLRPPRLGLSRAFIPDTWSFDHYIRLLSTPRFPRYILNSVINSLGGALVTTVVSALAGYACARYTFSGRSLFLIFIMGMLLLPGLTNLIPLYKLASDLGLLDSYLIMIAIYSAYGVPFGIWVMKSFIERIPRELQEAAAVDGASPLQIMGYIVLPLARPGLVAVFLFNFVYNWNDFLTALIMLSSTAMKTATVGLFDFQNQLTGNENELLAAACVIIMLPGLVVFLIARKTFMRAMLEGAVKG